MTVGIKSASLSLFALLEPECTIKGGAGVQHKGFTGVLGLTECLWGA